MPIKKEILLYKFDELSDKAKEKAREWFRSSVFTESHDWECVYEDAVLCAECLGIEIDTRNIPLMNGKTRAEPTIYFRGFSSQGDGACFEGRYSYVDDALKRIKDHAPKDEELHRIARELDEIQKENGNHVIARMKHRGHYYHAYCMDVDVDHSENELLTDTAQSQITELMRDFAKWIYRQLENEYDYQMEDETVDDNIRANDYTFLENGERED